MQGIFIMTHDFKLFKCLIVHIDIQKNLSVYLILKKRIKYAKQV